MAMKRGARSSTRAPQVKARELQRGRSAVATAINGGTCLHWPNNTVLVCSTHRSSVEAEGTCGDLRTMTRTSTASSFLPVASDTVSVHLSSTSPESMVGAVKVGATAVADDRVGFSLNRLPTSDTCTTVTSRYSECRRAAPARRSSRTNYA